MTLQPHVPGITGYYLLFVEYLWPAEWMVILVVVRLWLWVSCAICNVHCCMVCCVYSCTGRGTFLVVLAEPLNSWGG
jgi:hypothetical protein